ncbi:MAG: hypothetical protein ACTSRZ_02825 [Promethearchaeota archaeon]
MQKGTVKSFLFLWIILLSSISFSVLLFDLNIKSVKAAEYNINSTWIISSDQTNTSNIFTVSDNIVIKENVTATFIDCYFQFVATTPTYIQLEKNATLILDDCVLNGSENGNAYIYSDVNASLNIKDSQFINIGTSSNPTISFNGNETIIENSFFTGQYIRINFESPIELLIIKDNVFNSSNRIYNALNLLDVSKNILIKNNTFKEFYYAFYISNSYGNISVVENKLINNAHAIYISQAFISVFMGLNFSKNTFEGDYVYSWGSLYYIKESYITYNTLYDGIEGFILMDISNTTISNNIFHFMSPTFNNHNIFQINGDLNNCSIINNMVNANKLNQDINYLVIFNKVPIDCSFTNNYFNNKPVVLYKDQANLSLDLKGITDKGGFVFYNITNITLTNYNTHDNLGFSLYYCEEFLIDNITMKNNLNYIDIQYSNNGTIKNSKFIYDYNDSYSNFEIFMIDLRYDSNLTLYNNSFYTNRSKMYPSYVNLEYSDFLNISFNNYTNSNPALHCYYMNNATITNNTFIGDRIIFLSGDSSYNKINYNDFIKINVSEFSSQYSIEVYSFDNDSSWDMNHWSNYIDAEDLDMNGYADDPFIAFVSYDYKSIVDNNPLFKDLDLDGLDDLQEIYYYLTNPTNADTDGDLLNDYEEVKIGNDGYITSPFKADTDGDLLNDYEEVNIGTDGYITNPTISDTDGDLFTDFQEINSGTDPTNPYSYPGGILEGDKVVVEDEDEDMSNTSSSADKPTIASYNIFSLLCAILLGISAVYFIDKLFIKKSKLKIKGGLS